jgi:hypothetical protein
MKYKYRMLTIFSACLVLTPLLAAAGQPAYPKNFLNLRIPQLPGSKVIEVRYQDKVPWVVVLESEDTSTVKAMQYYDALKYETVGGGLWYPRRYSESEGIDLYKAGILQWSEDGYDLLFDNETSRDALLITISRKGSRGCRVELTYPWGTAPSWSDMLKTMKELDKK